MGTFDAVGTVTVGGRGAGGVTVRFAPVGGVPVPFVPPPVRTDKLGRWSQTGFDDRQSYRVGVEAAGLAFEPGDAVLDATHRDVRVLARPLTFTAGGVAQGQRPLLPLPGDAGKPPGLEGVTITFVRTAGRADVPLPAAVVTGRGGGWERAGFQVGTAYLAVPSRAGLAFRPSSVPVAERTATVVGGADLFSVRGRVTSAGGTPEPGVDIDTIVLTGAAATPAVAVTTADGRFEIALSRSASYRLSPRKLGLRFSPGSRDLAFRPGTVALASVGFERVTNLTVLGQVLSTGGAALLGAMVSFARVQGAGAVPQPVVSGSNGEFRAVGLDSGTTYEVTTRKDGFAFAPTALRGASAGTVTLTLTGSPAFDVAGTVRQVPSGAGSLTLLAAGPGADLDAIAPRLPGALVVFAAQDGGPAPRAVLTAADGSFLQSGFRVRAAYTAVARAQGFGPVAGIPVFGPGDDLSERAFSRADPGLLDGIDLFLQPDG